MKKFWSMRNAHDSQTGEIRIYGLIGSDAGLSWLFDEATPKLFQEDLDGLGNVKQIDLFVNSEGGDVFAGQAIHSMIRRHPAHVTAHVDGLAASIASVVVVAADHVVMPKNSMMMIHNPWTVAVGDAQKFRQEADVLDSVRESIIGAFQMKTEIPRDDLIGLLDAETWMTAQEAVDKGFADEVLATKSISASMVNPDLIMVEGLEMDLTGFRNRPAHPRHQDANRKHSNLTLDQHRMDAFVLAGELVERWKDLASDGPLSESRRKRVGDDLASLEVLVNRLRPLLLDAVGSGSDLAIEFELMQARLNGVNI